MSMVRVGGLHLLLSLERMLRGADGERGGGGVDQQQVTTESRQHVGDYLIAHHSHHVVAAAAVAEEGAGLVARAADRRPIRENTGG